MNEAVRMWLTLSSEKQTWESRRLTDQKKLWVETNTMLLLTKFIRSPIRSAKGQWLNTRVCTYCCLLAESMLHAMRSEQIGDIFNS
jgi:hypothetical protein